jgi:thiamine biosynthesis lipoprotein ApbE
MKALFLSAASVLALTASLANIGPPIETLPPWYVGHFENVLGTSMELKLRAASEADADAAEQAAMAEIKRLNGILSGYDASSEFSRWAKTRDEAVRVSGELMEVLSLWDVWQSRTGGALSPAAEAIARVWKRAEAAGTMPREVELGAAVRAARETQWTLDPKSGLATRLAETPLMLNSFTKSYIVERAAEAALRTPGVTGAVVNIGGDLVVRGDASDAVSVADPRSDSENSNPIALLNVRDRAVATSGSYRRGFDIGGRRYSHIVDPRTGQTADQIISATVVSPNAVAAGALATAFCVLTPEESRQLAASVGGVDYLLVRNDGVQIASAGWRALQSAQVITAPPGTVLAKGAAAATSDPGLWNSAYELTINVELPQARGFGARRPYLAVWVEDKDRFPVRTLAVWFDKMRWLNELRAWYRDDRLRSMSEGKEILNSVTSATRSPGKYSFKWDGKDNAGKLVKAGPYTILVEAAREHGGYTLDRHPIDFNGQPSQAQLPPDAELGAVSFDYHKAGR